VYELLAGVADVEGRSAGEVLTDMLGRATVSENGEHQEAISAAKP
jgi:hypothetical protein